MNPAKSLVVIIPALNEASVISELVKAVVPGAAACIVVDGGSTDNTPALARQAGAKVMLAPPGRAKQMNAGASEAIRTVPGVDFLLFLHADTGLPEAWLQSLAHCPPGRWARFDVELDSERLSGWRLGLLHLIGWFMNERSAATGICTGDQGLFIPVAFWHQVDGYPDIPLMEDIDISSRLKRVAGKPYRFRARVKVNPRRWEEQGVLKTMLLMWSYRLRWLFGASPQSLYARYYGSGQR